MPYDANMDKKLFCEVKDFESTRITVGVFSYNDGEKKLQLTRENMVQPEEWRFSKLGRMTKSEVEAVLPLMQSATKHM